MKQIDKNTNFLQSFIHAKNGLVYVVKTERNMRKHVCLALIICLVGIYFQCTLTEWLWISHAIALMFIMEIINTIIEHIVDVIANKNYHLWAKHIKDMAAGVVLLTAFYTIIIALMIFIPKLV